jgi:hypothetical protein
MYISSYYDFFNFRIYIYIYTYCITKIQITLYCNYGEHFITLHSNKIEYKFIIFDKFN